jgi:putative (di)nucleoside polyphosphate hydrolase
MTAAKPLRREDMPYRPCVGAMLLDRRGLVFAGRRIEQTVEGWQMPQGGIDEGEIPRDAVLRELEEEIGTAKATILREHPQWLTYDLPDHLLGIALKGKYRGQKQKWFAMRFTGEDRDIDLMTHHPEFDAWRWVAPAELPALIVPFKRQLYREILDEFRGVCGLE